METIMRRKKGIISLSVVEFVLISFMAMAVVGGTLMPDTAWGVPATLQGVPVPDPPNLADFVADRNAAIRLGKALFWDMQAGSDGIQACASCHFNAGADNRAKNQLSPGLLATPRDTTFQIGGPNFTLGTANFEFVVNDVASSQGVFNRNFSSITPGSAVDLCVGAPDPDGFTVGGINVRKVEPRNTPTVINAVFNFHNFWDGRADNNFNGTTPRGVGQGDSPIFQNIGGILTQVVPSIPNGSAASQSVGPPRSNFEMSCAGRTFPNIGKKVLSLTPLGKQRVASDDSVLGSIANTQTDPLLKGLSPTYPQMIQQAFVSSWWNSADSVTIGNQTFTQMEANFPLFWGLAIQLYEATLISDQTPFDRFSAPVPDPNALTFQQQAGLAVFNGQGRCDHCHDGALISLANDPAPLIAFRNIGVRPNAEDPLAGPIFGAGFEGRAKIAQLRNVELTAPYFHNGGHLTLDQVVDFYNAGGDFPNELNHDGQVRPLGLTAQEMVNLVTFLKSLTDERVRFKQAPFDHPSLCVPNGHPGNEASVTESSPGSGEAGDSLQCIRAIGRNGSPTPLRTFPPQPLFSDTTFATNFIEEIASAGITAGCGQGKFCPDAPVTRAQMAVLLEAALGNPANACTGLFSDANAATVGATVCGFIERLAQDGITGGCGPGVFCPNDPVTRAQTAVFLEAALGHAANACAGTFTDADAIAVGPAFCGFIERLAAEGITAGCGGGNFCPNDPVTRAQMAVFLAVAFLF